MAMQPAPERIKALRELRGWTQTEFAQITGFSQNLVSAWETGQRTVALAHLNLIAETTGTPFGFFTLQTEDLSSAGLHFRMKKAAKVTATRTVVRKFSEMHSLARRIAAPYQSRASVSYIEGDISSLDIEDLALDLRRELGHSADRPIGNVTRDCERAGIPVGVFDPVPGADSNHDGLSYTSPDGFASIAYAAGQSGDRLRMTVGHELAHRVLHTHRSVPEQRREKEAFRLSGAFFLPRGAAYDELSPHMTMTGYMRVKARWGISMSALIMRAHELAIIDEDRKTALMKQMSRRGWRSNEPVDVDVEEPALLWHLLVKRFGPDPYGRAQAELGYAERDLQEWIPSQSLRNARSSGHQRSSSVKASVTNLATWTSKGRRESP